MSVPLFEVNRHVISVSSFRQATKISEQERQQRAVCDSGRNPTQVVCFFILINRLLYPRPGPSGRADFRIEGDSRSVLWWRRQGEKQVRSLPGNNDKLRDFNHTLFDLWIIRHTASSKFSANNFQYPPFWEIFSTNRHALWQSRCSTLCTFTRDTSCTRCTSAKTKI